MSEVSSNKKPQGSKKARASAARLAAVQAVYQMIANDQTAASVISEFQLHRIGKPVDGVDMVTPDDVLFQAIVQGTYDRWNDLEAMIESALAKSGKPVTTESLLLAVLMCGAWELLAHAEADTALIIAEYLNVAHAFYDQGEAKLIHAILDQVKAAIR